MYFNFDESRPDTPRLDRSLTRLEQILLTLLLYALVVIATLLGPRLPFVRALEAQQQQALQQRLKEQEDLRSRSEFVFVQPKIDIVTKVPPKLAELSDRNRKAQTIEEHYSARAGHPQPMDIEWAKDGESGELFIVQARPETTRP